MRVQHYRHGIGSVPSKGIVKEHDSDCRKVKSKSISLTLVLV